MVDQIHKKMKRKEKGRCWRVSGELSCWSEHPFAGLEAALFIAEEFHPSRVLKSLFNLACDSSFDVEFNCNWNSLGEKLFRGSWNCFGSDWVGFGLLKTWNSVSWTISRSAVFSAVKVICPVIWPVSSSDWANHRPDHVSASQFSLSSASDLGSDLQVSWANRWANHCCLLPPGFCFNLIWAVIGADFLVILGKSLGKSSFCNFSALFLPFSNFFLFCKNKIKTIN